MEYTHDYQGKGIGRPLSVMPLKAARYVRNFEQREVKDYFAFKRIEKTYSTVTDFARFLGLSTSQPFSRAI